VFPCCADAVQIAQFKRVQHLRQLAVFDDLQPVGLAHLAGDLRQVLVRPGADAHLDDRRDVPGHVSLMRRPIGLDGGPLAQVVRQPGPHFVDAQHGLDVDAVLDRLDDRGGGTGCIPAGLASTMAMPGQSTRASLMRVPVFTPNALAS
jgi:hypothetical protein